MKKLLYLAITILICCNLYGQTLTGSDTLVIKYNYTVTESENIKLEVGQVWQDKTKNPFVDDFTKVILDIKNGYVQFRFWDLEWKWSDRVKIFKYDSKLIGILGKSKNKAGGAI